jgi:hypothetical protein
VVDLPFKAQTGKKFNLSIFHVQFATLHELFRSDLIKLEAGNIGWLILDFNGWIYLHITLRCWK